MRRHPSRQSALVGLLVTLLTLLAACGRVVSVETETPTATAAPTQDPSRVTVPSRPTVTRAQPTEPPPNTPTPSPTPIIHVVRSGETLIAIALQYGVTVDALQSANGIQDPSTLQVDQRLFVPTGAESRRDDAALLDVTPTPISFAIEGLHCYRQAVGSLWCLGEAVNSGPTALENVQVRVSLLDDSGNELLRGEVSAALDLIRSGRRAPFGVLFDTFPESYARAQATPLRAETSNEPANRYAPLEVAVSEANPVGSLFEVLGTVNNPTAQAADAVTVVVTTYDGEGQVTGFRQSRMADSLPAGASLEFAVSLMPHGGLPASYNAGVQGRLAPP